MNENPSDTEMTELHTDVERSGQAPDAAAAEQPVAAEGAPVSEQAPQAGPEVEEPSAEVAPATEESSAAVTPAAEQASAGETIAAAQSEQPAGEAPAEQASDDAQAPAAEAAGNAQASAEQAAGDAEPQAAEQSPADADKPKTPLISTEDPPPGAGPKILGMAEDLAPPPVPPVKASLKDIQRQRPRRRRLNATQRHRNVFFARLNEFRRQAQAGQEPRTDAEAAEAEAAEAQAAEAQAAEAVDAQAAEAQVTEVTDAQAAEAQAAGAEGAEPQAAQAPAGEGDAAADGEAAQAAEPQQEQRQQQSSKRRSAPPPPVDRPRLIAAIERAGGPDVVIEALQPKRDENDQPLKWATVCADACKGLKPSDPVFSAWVRLAATPVSAIKSELGLTDRRDERRRRGPRRDRRRDDRGRGGASREDYQRHVIGGRVGANIRIIGLERLQGEKKEREERRKAEREAKREAERERLARLGY